MANLSALCECGQYYGKKTLATVLAIYDSQYVDGEYKGTHPLRITIIEEYVKANAEEVAELLFKILDAHGLMEHGSSVPGWLTENGRKFRDRYINHGNDDYEKTNTPA